MAKAKTSSVPAEWIQAFDRLIATRLGVERKAPRSRTRRSIAT